MSKIFHASLHGLSSVKEKALSTLDLNTTQWSHLDIESSNFYLFIPQNNDLRREYDRFWKITEIMKINVLGFQTHRDHFAIDLDRERLLERIREMRDEDISDYEFTQKYLLKDNRDWNLKEARKQLKDDSDWESQLIECLYRPFDKRPCYFSKIVMDYPRRELIDHVAGKDNLCLNIVRQTKAGQWQHSLVSDCPTPAVFVEMKDGSSVFPLHLYPTTQAEKDMGITRTHNISPEFLTKIQQNLGYLPTPEAIFYYIYAIFHSPTYRSRYAEFLKIDFPRVPLTSDDNLFRKLGELGEELVNLHLMKTTVPQSTFIENGGGCNVDAGHPKYVDGKVIINKKQDGFIDVPAEVWNFHVGGYQVLSKWLKDRKGRVLSQEDITHYRGIVGALSATIRVMGEIDKAIPGFPIQ